MPSLLRNYLYNSLLTAANMVFPLAIFIFVSRVIGPEGIGKVGFAQTFGGYFGLFGIFGAQLYGVREVARVREDAVQLKKVFNEIFVINCITVGFAIAVFAVSVVSNQRLRAEGPLYAVTGLSVLLGIFSFDWLFQGLENYRYIMIRSIAVKAFSAALVFVLVRKSSDYVLFAALTVLGISANYIFNFLYAQKLVGFDLSHLELRRHVPALSRFALITFASSLYVGMDKIVLGFLQGDYYVGLYAPAEKISRLGLSIIAAASAVLLPRTSNLFANGAAEEFKRHVSTSLHAVMLIAIPLFVAIELLAGPLILLVSGNAYVDSIATLRLEALIVIPVAIANVAGYQVLIATNEESKYLLSIIVGAIIFFLTAFLAIPLWKQNGAALAVAGAEMAGAACELFFARKHLSGMLKGHWLGKCALATTAMAGLVAAFTRLAIAPLPLFMFSAIGGVVVYALAEVILKDELIFTGFLALRKRMDIGRARG